MIRLRGLISEIYIISIIFVFECQWFRGNPGYDFY